MSSVAVGAGRAQTWGWWRKAGSFAWALLPLVTIGFGAPVAVGYAAARTRSTPLWVATGGYTALLAATVVLSSGGGDTGWEGNLGAALGMALIAMATGHCLAVRRRVFSPAREAMRQADESAGVVLHQRDAARVIVVKNPRMADQLRIGRPDLPRQFDDGGLVDVNHVPLQVLVDLGIPGDLANRIVATRDAVGGYESLDDLEINLFVVPRSLDHLADRMVFIR